MNPLLNRRAHLSVIVLFITALMTSCSSSNQVASNSIIQKRKHTKGFYFNSPWNGNKALAKVKEPENEIFHEEIAVTPTDSEETKPNLSEKLKVEEFKSAGKIYQEEVSKSTSVKDYKTARKNLNRKVDEVFSSIPQTKDIEPNDDNNNPTGTNGFAIASFVLGISSFVFMPLIGGILAIAFGAVALKNIKEYNQEGRGLALAGLILGIVNVVLLLLYIAFVIILLTAFI